MVLVQFLQETCHYGSPVQRRPGMDIETPAVFVDYRHFIIIQIDNLTMPPDKGGFLLF
jgi:hypothetical protein